MLIDSETRTISMSRRRYYKNIFYSRKKYNNPFFNRRRRKVSYFSLKTKLIMIISGFLALLLGWSLLFNNYFIIDNVVIKGAQNIKEYKIYDIIQKQTNKKRLFFFDQYNIFSFNKQQAKNEILRQYFVDDLKINKNLPHTLMISFQEKTPAAVWLEGETYYYIDQHFNIINKIDSLEIDTERFIVLKSESGGEKIKTVDLIKKVGIGESYLAAALALAGEFKNIEQKIDNIFIIDDREATLTTNFINGPKIYFTPENDLGEQFKNLTTLLNEKLTGEQINKISYIDLRFGDKLYYK